MKYREVTPTPTRPATAHLSAHLFQYIEGIARIRNQSLSATLSDIVQEHLDQAAKTVAITRKSKATQRIEK